jgi:hypothetical protein
MRELRDFDSRDARRERTFILTNRILPLLCSASPQRVGSSE